MGLSAGESGAVVCRHLLHQPGHARCIHLLIASGFWPPGQARFPNTGKCHTTKPISILLFSCLPSVLIQVLYFCPSLPTSLAPRLPSTPPFPSFAALSISGPTLLCPPSPLFLSLPQAPPLSNRLPCLRHTLTSAKFGLSHAQNLLLFCQGKFLC